MKKSISTAILIILSLGALVLLLEAVTRLAFESPPTVVIENLNTDTTKVATLRPAGTLQDGTLILERLPDYGLYMFTPTGTRLKPSTRAILRNHPFGLPEVFITTNSQGFRHPQITEKQEGEIRMLVLGDSITLGDWLPLEQTYPARIGFHLNETKPESSWNVINAGVGAIDLQTELAIFVEKGLSIDPDLVLVGMYLNDAYGSPSLRVSTLPAPLRGSHLAMIVLQRLDLLRSVYTAKQWESNRKETIQDELDRYVLEHGRVIGGEPVFDTELERQIYHSFTDWGYAWSAGFLKRTAPILELLKRTADDNGVELLVMLLPVSEQVYSKKLVNEPQVRMGAALAKMSIPYLDILPVLRARVAVESTGIFFDHCHYTQAGNDLVGQTAADFVLQNLGR